MTKPGLISEEDIVSEIIEHDFIVKMKPKKKYKTCIFVKNREKSKPTGCEVKIEDSRQ